MRPVLRFVSTAAAMTLLVGCHRAGGATSKDERATLVSVTPCPPAAPLARGEEPSRSKLTLLLRPDIPVASGTEASLKLDGEVTRNSMRIPVNEPSEFTLDAGPYVVRVALKGYTSLEGRVRLTPGCDATMTLSLRKLAAE